MGPFSPSINCLSLSLYPGELIDSLIEREYLDENKYRLFASQFRLHSDSSGSWRGEFWGKFVRGACFCYASRPSKKLYKIIEDSVFELISYIENDGTLSSYVKEERFSGWDMWGRKYALIGMLSYLSICKSKEKKAKVIRALTRQADAIMKSVGPNKNQIGILKTATNYGSMASVSILGVYVDLYSLTGKAKYLDFASYIVSTGLSSTDDLIEKALQKGSYPYQWKSKKAYEMNACFQGLFRYGLAKGDERAIKAAISYTKKVAESEFTITGGIGIENEFYSHSSLRQTEPPSKPGLETCVTVSFMGLCFDLLAYTNDSYYAELIERMGYNALFGSFNDLGQTMELSEGRVWNLEGYTTVPHEPYCFDSYSPLVSDRRCQVIGGFMVMQEGKTYGCCAANGGYGLGLLPALALHESQGGFAIDFYSSFKAKAKRKNKSISFKLTANMYKSGKASLKISGSNERFPLRLRIPSWAKMSLALNGKPLPYQSEQGYAVIDRVWDDDTLLIRLSFKLKRHLLNGKVAYTRGPIVLAEDARLGGFADPLPRRASGKAVKNDAFKNNLTIKLSSKQRLIDYSSSGKNMDDPHSGLTVWANIKD